jgi:L-cystine uptake protein TcyP (sodium:dicarboxylate symporter family)
MALFTYETLWTFLALIGFCLGIVFIAFLNSRLKLAFTWRVLTALALGVLFGVVLQLIFGPGTKTATGTLIKQWVNIVGDGFVHALQFLVVPLVLVSIIKSIAQFGDPKQGAKTAGKIIAFLLVTTLLSCVITIIVIRIYGLNADKLVNSQPVHHDAINIAQTILNMVPVNLFSSLSTNNSILSIVFIAVLIGFANLAIKQKNPGISQQFERGVEIARVFVMELVRTVINFTPYGVLATVTQCAAGGDWDSVKQMGLIIAGAFTAMAIIFCLHLLIVTLLKVSPVTYLRQAGGTLLFAFSSRSSSASLPLTIRALQNLGVSEVTANLAATLGTCIGQNACSGVQPALVAILVAQVQHTDVWGDPGFLIQLVIYVVIASIGTAGVGGGATNVSIMVLSMLALPLDLVGVLISVDFIIDMGRTMINVNDSIVAGVFVSKIEKTLDDDVLLGRKPVFDSQNTSALLVDSQSMELQAPPGYTDGNEGTCTLNF